MILSVTLRYHYVYIKLLVTNFPSPRLRRGSFFYVLATLAAWGLHALPPYKILCVGKSCQHIKDLLVPAYYTSIPHGGRGRTLPAQYLLTNRQQPGLTYVDVRLHATS